MWYKTKVGPYVENAARELAVHMSYPAPEHWKALECLIGYIKGKETEGIIIRKPKVLKVVMLCDSNYATYKDTRNSVSGLIATLGGTLLTCLSETQRNLRLISTEEEYVAMSACAQEVKLVSIFMGETNEVKQPSVIYENSQGAIFLANNSQVGILTKHIDIRHHFLQDMVEGKDIDIQYIRSEENPDDIMTKNTLEADLTIHMRRITEGELWEIMGIGKQNFYKTGVTDDFITRDKIEYSSHAISEM